jgi:hypothetical protein
LKHRTIVTSRVFGFYRSQKFSDLGLGVVIKVQNIKRWNNKKSSKNWLVVETIFIKDIISMIYFSLPKTCRNNIVCIYYLTIYQKLIETKRERHQK